MPIGDAADAAGFVVLAGTEDLRQSYIEHNRSRDYLAEHQSTGTHPASAITSGTLDAARIPTLDESKITAAASVKSGTNSVVFSTDHWRANRKIIGDESIEAIGLLRTVAGYSNDIAGTRRAVWMDANGYLGWASSSEAGKVNIERLAIDPRAILAVDTVLFQRRALVEAEAEHVPTEVGMIAERLHEAGLWPFVIYDDDHATPIGIHYELWSLAVHVVAQWLAARVDDLEARMVALEKATAKGATK